MGGRLFVRALPGRAGQAADARRLCGVRGGRERSGKAAAGSLAGMLSGLIRLILFRVLGARVMLALAVFGWLRRFLGGKKDEAAARGRTSARTRSAYQPSQGSSQIVQRDPR